IGRIGGDELMAKARVEEIESRFWHIGILQLLGVVAVEDRDRIHRDPGAVLVLHRRKDLLEALGLVMLQRAGLVPAAIVLDCLELDVVGGDLLVLELLIDLEIKNVAEAPLAVTLIPGKRFSNASAPAFAAEGPAPV